MPRPSRNLDRALLAAGRELLPARGCAGLSVREVAEAAGVNLGMFHYHFKSREAFLRELLQGMYEEMFSQLSFQGAAHWGPLDNLRAALRFLGRFLRLNRPLIARVMADALCGDPIAVEFLRLNMPRHLGVMHALVVEAQARGQMRAMPPEQALAFCAAGLATPILFAGAVADSGAVPKTRAKALADTLASDRAIDERIDLALVALAPPAPAAVARARSKP